MKMTVLFLFAALAVASATVDPNMALNDLNAIHENVKDNLDDMSRNFKDALTPEPANGEIIGDKDPSAAPAQPAESSSGLFGSLHLPNLFSGLSCIGSTSLLTGKCDTTAACAKQGRVVDGKGLCLEKNVCCVDTLKCGGLGLLNNSIFTSPNYPEGTRQAGQCTMTVKKLPLIRAIRIVFEDIVLSPPNAHGECNADGLWVEGVNAGSEVGRICGRVVSQHLYFPIGESTDDSIRIKVVLSPSNFQRRWLIRVSQIEAISPSLPPAGCSQYFTGTSGSLVSFNADIQNLTGLGNLDGLKYAICLRKESGFCKVEFESVFFDMGSSHFAPHVARRNMAAPMAAPMAAGHRRPLARPVYPHVPMHIPMHHPLKVTGASKPANYHPEPLYTEAMLNRLLDAKLEAKLQEYGMSAPITGFYTTAAPIHIAPAAPVLEGTSRLYHPTNEIVDEALYEPIVSSHGPSAAGNAMVHSPLAKVCAGQDTIVMPPPDDETNSIHCGSDFHGGHTMVTSARPFLIRVHNKGLVHGKGFIIRWRHVIC